MEIISSLLVLLFITKVYHIQKAFGQKKARSEMSGIEISGRPTFRPAPFCPTGFGPKLFVHSCFRPILFLSNLLSSKTYNRPFCFCPILVQPNLTLLLGRKGSWTIIGLGQKQIGRKHDWTKSFGPKSVERKVGARK